MCQDLFFNKVTLAQAFAVNFAKVLRTIFQRTPLGDCFCADLNILKRKRHD